MADHPTPPAPKKRKQKPPVHRPITVNVLKVTDLPTVRDLLQETKITVNLKMTRTVALKLSAEINRQLAVGDFVDHVAITITGIS